MMAHVVKDPVRKLPFKRVAPAYIPQTAHCVELVRKHMKGIVDLQLSFGGRSDDPRGGPTLRVEVEVLAGAEPIEHRDRLRANEYLTEAKQRAAWAAFEAECDAEGERIRRAS